MNTGLNRTKSILYSKESNLIFNSGEIMRLARTLITAALALAVAGGISAPAQAAGEISPYPDQSSRYVNLSTTAATSVTIKDTSTLGANTNDAITATYIPQSRKLVKDYGWVPKTRQETRYRTVNTYGWVRIKEGQRAPSPDGAPVIHNPIATQFLWAGNNTTSNGYGAHDEWQPYLGAGSTYWWMANQCDGSALYTSYYQADGQPLQAGFWEPATRNPFRSGDRTGNHARGGIVGGDPLMRWSGHSGYGWYYSCYRWTTDHLQITGSYQEAYQVTVGYNEWEEVGYHYEYYNKVDPADASIQNISRVQLRCAADTFYVTPQTNDRGAGYADDQATGVAWSAKMRLKISGNVLNVEKTDGVALDPRLSNITIPASCFNPVAAGVNPDLDGKSVRPS